MKKIISIISILSALSAFAFYGVIPAKNINLANKYLTKLIADYGLDDDVSIVSGSVDHSGLLNSLELKIKKLEGLDLAGNLKVQMQGNALLAETKSMTNSYTQEEIDELVDYLIDELDDLDNVEDANVKFSYSIVDTASTKIINLKALPKSPKYTLNWLKGQFTIDKKNQKVTVKANLSMKSDKDIVVEAQMALTNIFNSLVAQKDPDEEDFLTLLLIYLTVIAEL